MAIVYCANVVCSRLTECIFGKSIQHLHTLSLPKKAGSELELTRNRKANEE